MRKVMVYLLICFILSCIVSNFSFADGCSSDATFTCSQAGTSGWLPYYLCTIGCDSGSGCEDLNGRTFYYQEPSQPTADIPVVFLFHGAGQGLIYNPPGQVWFGLTTAEKAVKNDLLNEGFAVIVPNAVQNVPPEGCGGLLAGTGGYRWNYWDIDVPENDDLQLVNLLLDDLVGCTGPGVNFDKKNVHATGISAGAAMTMVSAWHFRSRIKSASINSGGLIECLNIFPGYANSPCNPSSEVDSSGNEPYDIEYDVVPPDPSYPFDPPHHPPMMINHYCSDIIASPSAARCYHNALAKNDIPVNTRIKSTIIPLNHGWVFERNGAVIDWFQNELNEFPASPIYTKECSRFNRIKCSNSCP